MKHGPAAHYWAGFIVRSLFVWSVFQHLGVSQEQKKNCSLLNWYDYGLSLLLSMRSRFDSWWFSREFSVYADDRERTLDG